MDMEVVEVGEGNFEELILTVVPSEDAIVHNELIRNDHVNRMDESSDEKGEDVPEGSDSILLKQQSQEQEQGNIGEECQSSSLVMFDPIKYDEEVKGLKSRIEQLEEQVHFLEDELRLVRKKVKVHTEASLYSNIKKTVIEILKRQKLKISLSDIENDEQEQDIDEEYRQRMENGVSDGSDFGSDNEFDLLPRKRRCGRPSRYLTRSTRRLKSNRIELTPPPPIRRRTTGRPRGRPPRKAIEVSPAFSETASPCSKNHEIKEIEETVTTVIGQNSEGEELHQPPYTNTNPPEVDSKNPLTKCDVQRKATGDDEAEDDAQSACDFGEPSDEHEFTPAPTKDFKPEPNNDSSQSIETSHSEREESPKKLLQMVEISQPIRTYSRLRKATSRQID